MVTWYHECPTKTLILYLFLFLAGLNLHFRHEFKLISVQYSFKQQSTTTTTRFETLFKTPTFKERTLVPKFLPGCLYARKPKKRTKTEMAKKISTFPPAKKIHSNWHFFASLATPQKVFQRQFTKMCTILAAPNVLNKLVLVTGRQFQDSK